MKFVKGLSILGLAMASQGAWALPGDQSIDVHFSAAATCAASIAVIGGAVGNGFNPIGVSSNPIILTAAIRDDRKLAVSGHGVLKVKSKCGYKITLTDMVLAETEQSGNNTFTVEPSLISRGDTDNDSNSTATPDETGFIQAVKTADVATPLSESEGNEHSIYIREIAAPTSADRGFSYRPLTGKVVVTVVEL